MNTFLNSLTYSMLLFAVLPVAVQAQNLAQTQSQNPDAQGNYYSNFTNVQAPQTSYNSSGSLWRVVAENLDCRRSPNLKSLVLRTFQKNILIEAEVYRGGSDEVLVNLLDENGQPWMNVRGRNRSEICLVRANSLYIEPVNNISP